MQTKIAVCASGDGSNFEALVHAARLGDLSAEVTGLIVNRAQAGARARAERLQVPCAVLSPKDFKERADWDQALVDQLRAWQVEWVVLAGFLLHLGPRLLAAFPERVVNSHPSLLPKFGGAGMYGSHVHAAVLAAGEPETGITVHLVNSVYDSGRVIAQSHVLVKSDDTVDTLSDRVKKVENSMYPKVLQELILRSRTTS